MSTSPTPNPPQFSKPLDWALYHYRMGFTVLPIIADTKKPAVKWDPWQNSLSEESICKHWDQHPDHQIGAIVGNKLIVFDADAPEAVQALKALEITHGLVSNFVVKTRKGEHHYFLRPDDVHARSCSFSTDQYPDRIDVKTGKSLIVMPGSKNKTIEVCNFTNVTNLTAVTQAFVDDVFKHNQTPLADSSHHPRPYQSIPDHVTNTEQMTVLRQLLGYIDPSCGYDDWLKVLMAIYHQTRGGDDGLLLADQWSSRGNNYQGTKSVETKWRTFSVEIANPVTIGSLIRMAEEGGADLATILSALDTGFEPCQAIVETPNSPVSETRPASQTLLAKFSIRGQSAEIEQQMGQQLQVLGSLALSGQITIIYAPPNHGKTLICLSLLIDGIQTGRINNPEKAYYINVDDTAQGLLEKLRLAEEYGFHMLAEGHKGFEANHFLRHIETMVAHDQVQGMLIILDTVKKVTNLMDKAMSSRFTEVMRKYALKGGTLIGLAHTNKNPGTDGKNRYGGTSDLVDDVDCVYVIDTISQQADGNQKVVEFTNLKRRGNVPNKVTYRYALERDIAYTELLLSVQEIDPALLEPIKEQVGQASNNQAIEDHKIEQEVIETVISCIQSGVCTKMTLVTTVADRTGISRRRTLKIIEKYTGDDPTQNRWSYAVGERGAKVFSVHDTPGSLGVVDDTGPF